MRKEVTYDQIHPLVQYVEVVSDIVQCHFHCPVKSKKIVAITRLSMLINESKPEKRNPIKCLKLSALFNLKKYFCLYEEPEDMKNIEIHKENAVVHAFGKISDRFIWSEEHKHFVYRF